MKTIKSKIILRIVLMVTVGSVAIGLITALMNAANITSMLRNTMTPVSAMAADAIEWRMDKYWVALQEAAASPTFQEEEPSSSNLISTASGIAERNGFLYLGKTDANGVSATGSTNSNTAAFNACRDSMAPYITDLTFDGTQYAFFLEVPIITDGRFNGLVYGAVNADFLVDIVKGLTIGEQGVSYILDKNGTVIGHPDRTFIEEGSNMIEIAKSDSGVKSVADVNSRMIAGESGFASYNYYGDSKYISFAPIGGNLGWSVGIEVSKSEFMMTLNICIAVTGGIVIISIILSIIVSIRLAHSIVKPIKACVDRMALLAQGDLQTEVPHFDIKGETARLIEALDQTITGLTSVVGDITHHLTKMGDGDFTEEITRNYKGDFYPIETAMKAIHRSLKSTLLQITISAEQVASSADQVAAGATALSQGATEQASSTEELAATITDISGHVQDNANTTSSANDFAHQAGLAMEESDRKMQQLIAAIQDINTASDKISAIISTIEDIAFQTNILALNAAVEAARAGEAGKGFAVVASEVRSLASKSQDASKNTALLIGESRQAVQKGINLVDETAESLHGTVESVENIVKMLEQISSATEQQADAIEQITIGVDQISTVVQTTSATSEENAATAEELSGQSQIMNEMVARFKLK